MEQKQIIDDLIKSTLIEEGLDIPSSGFTDRVMQRVAATEMKSEYRPLISRPVMIALVAGFVLVILFFMITGDKTHEGIPYMSNILGWFQYFQFKFSLPSQLVYIIPSVMLVLLIQAILIGRFYRKTYR